MVFEEKQKLSQWWIWIILIGTTLIPVYGIFQQIFLGKPFGNNPMSDVGLIIFLVAMIALDLFCWSITLRTRIDRESIKFELSPLVKRDIKWDNVQKAEIVNYGFVGGFGIRAGSKYGTVYNASGKMGLALVLKNGTKLCIGTQKEEDLKNFLLTINRNF